MKRFYRFRRILEDHKLEIRNKFEIQISQCLKRVLRSQLYIGDVYARVLVISILVIWYCFGFRVSIFLFKIHYC